MAEIATTFWSMLALSFGVMIFFSGAFTAYFGAGKSRKIGLGLLLVGLLTLLLFAGFVWNLVPIVADLATWDPETVAAGVVAVAAAGLGTFVALAIFLIAIMKA